MLWQLVWDSDQGHEPSHSRLDLALKVGSYNFKVAWSGWAEKTHFLRGKHNFPLSNPWKIIKNEENASKTSLVLRLGIGAMAQNLTFLSLELAPPAQHPYLNWCPSFRPYGGPQHGGLT